MLLCRHHHQASSGLCLVSGSFPFYFLSECIRLFEEPHVCRIVLGWVAYHFVLKARLAFFERVEDIHVLSIHWKQFTVHPGPQLWWWLCVSYGGKGRHFRETGILSGCLSEQSALPWFCFEALIPCLLLPLGLISWTNQAVFFACDLWEFTALDTIWYFICSTPVSGRRWVLGTWNWVKSV